MIDPERGRARPIDLARRQGISTQAVRNYEDAGILLPAERTPSGYRAYEPVHAHALRTFLALVPGHGHASATAVMVAVNTGRPDDAFALIDASHLRLVRDRETLGAVERASPNRRTGVQWSRATAIRTRSARLRIVWA